ncbi:MAG: cytochrome b5 domain-containing protein [Sphingobacteriia bacterium]
MDILPEYSTAELALRNGQDRPEIWTAYQGIIYDVTDSKLWRNGKHYQHWAGCDLTAEMERAPHTQRVFDGLRAVGRLKDYVPTPGAENRQ